jgi:putative hydrolase
MKLIADTHTHTIASTHAYSTLQENAAAAAKQGLSALAVTDHGALMPGAPGPWYFANLNVIPRRLDGVLILRGEETNVIDGDGRTDLIPSDLNTLEWVVASIHGPTFNHYIPDGNGGWKRVESPRPATPEDITGAWLAIAKNPRVNVIGHCGTDSFMFDYETVIPEFRRNGKLVELNESSFRNRKNSIPNCRRIMELCKKHSVPIVVDSDAHFSTQIGSFTNSLALLAELDFPEELVVNSSTERFEAYLREHTGVFRQN